MVTGDQGPTAAAIANKVNIIKHPKNEYNYLVNEKGLSPADAMSQATGIVVHGDILAAEHIKEEAKNLEDDDPKKGAYL
jgi:magnesium-transporting ATPase (P-type)